MRNMPVDIHDANLLIVFFERLVAIIQTGNPYLQQLLTLATLGKKAVIQLDYCKIRLECVQTGENVKVRAKKAGKSSLPQMSMESAFLKDWAAGMNTLDNAILQHKILIYGRLEDVTSIYNLVLGLMADSPLNPKLQQLWSDFEREWPFLQRKHDTLPLLDAQLSKICQKRHF